MVYVRRFRSYNAWMIRDFYDLIDVNLRIAILEHTGEQQLLNPAMLAQLDPFYARYGVDQVLVEHRLDWEGATPAEHDETPDRFRRALTRTRQEQLDHLGALRGLLVEALHIAAELEDRDVFVRHFGGDKPQP